MLNFALAFQTLKKKTKFTSVIVSIASTCAIFVEPHQLQPFTSIVEFLFNFPFFISGPNSPSARVLIKHFNLFFC